jgi:hypothetical protein
VPDAKDVILIRSQPADWVLRIDGAAIDDYQPVPHPSRMADSLAEEYFAKYTAPDAASVLLSLPTSPEKTFEDDWLDFKSSVDPRTGNPLDDKKIQEIWSKVLSAMANAGGGVVIWGLIAEKAGDPPIDAVSDLALVPDVELLKAKLTEFRRFATDPPLHGVKIEAIPRANGEKEGFVACLIPAGEHKPYQSVKTKLYYFRSGDSSSPAQRSILQQLFNPTLATRPRLIVTVSHRQIGQYRMRQFEFDIANMGRTTIESCFVKIESEDLAFVIIQQGKVNPLSMPEFIELPPVLHPGMCHKFTIVHDRVKRQHKILACAVTLFQRHNAPQSVNLLYDYDKETSEPGSEEKRIEAYFQRSP